jgi:nucleotide-binding universal stress UspA family protein
MTRESSLKRYMYCEEIDGSCCSGGIDMKILLATDGSEFSQAAIKKCCEVINGAKDASVGIVSVYEAQVPMAAEPFAISAEFYQKLDELAEGRARLAADKAAETLRTTCKQTTFDISTEVQLGVPAEVIIAAAEKCGADLIIVGSHGRGFWGRLTLGSVSDAVVHHSPCSVLVVRSNR